MERMHLWRRVWLRLQRKNSRTYRMATRTVSAPERGNPPPSSRYVLGRRPFSFASLSMAVGFSLRPKCLLDVDCTNLLMGGSNQYEDFSSTCWLEDHLHRFGRPASHPHTTSTSHLNTSAYPTTSSSSGETSDDMNSVDSGSEGGDVEFYNRVNIDSGNIINLHRYPYVHPDHGVMEPLRPPPYADEPPPTYEEAIAGNSLFEDDYDNTDFMW